MKSGYAWTHLLHRINKHISVFPRSKWAAGRSLHCVVHNAILPGMIACGRMFFVLAPRALASAACSPRCFPMLPGQGIFSEPKALWLLASTFHSILSQATVLRLLESCILFQGQIKSLFFQEAWRPGLESLFLSLACPGSSCYNPPPSRGTLYISTRK